MDHGCSLLSLLSIVIVTEELHAKLKELRTKYQDFRGS